LALVESLQTRFVQSLEKLDGGTFQPVKWFRDEGRHGGGERYGAEDTILFGRASVNVSQVHYEDIPGRGLASASALSAIVHPAHPRAPSVHIHISWTERKDGAGYWRIMADLNPSLPNDADKKSFSEALQQAAPQQFEEASGQGDRYFYIPVLERHRGVVHFYLENHNSGNFAQDLSFARSVGETAIDTYVRILEQSTHDLREPAEEELTAQLAYHTLYFFQVLTLDRGTTMGLLVHDQNDIGILGSLPPRIEKNLLASWRSRMPAPQDLLLDDLLGALPRQRICEIDDAIKQKLATAVRAHYRTYPEALELQASGNSTPPTLENHR
ncbi:MAG: coproporphyrinogen III oxidase, partial [Kiritimatiellales bacterium]|nr:coproporphyrinogen III oxidase [Kiritimatiellales bacterium]